MKHGSIKILALLMIVLLCGCAVPGDSRDMQSSRDEKVYQLVNSQSESEFLPYAMEYPSVYDSEAIPLDGQSSAAAKPLITFSNGESDEVRAVWISYLELDTLLRSKTEAQFTKNIKDAFDNIKDFGLNAVVVQVRPFGDALYESSLFPWSYTITGTEGKDPGFDPLAIMLREAKSRGLRFDAWINPYRVRASGNSNVMSADNQAKIWLDAGDRAVIRYNGITSYNPASAKAQQHIIDGVREIIRSYDVDAIHIDDYFYPTTDEAFDQTSYSAYQQTGGSLSLADWRRSNIEALLSGIYKAVKEENSKVLFGVSPQGNVQMNYNSQYLDVEKIISNSGYCDYVCPQVYYGFDNESQPFAEVVKDWDSMAKGSPVKLYIGLAAYKLGNEDAYAGTGKSEWLKTTAILREMVEESRKLGAYTGFVLYRYDSVFRPDSAVASQVGKECDNLKKIL